MPKSRIRLVASEAELTVKCPFNSVWRDCAHADGGHRDRQRRLWVFAPEKGIACARAADQRLRR